MFGQYYLATRDRLSEVISAIMTLGKRSKAELGEVDEDALRVELQRPFRIVVCGEGKAGKTSFLEVLLGREFEDLEQKVDGEGVVIYRDVANRVRDEREDGCAKRYLDRMKSLEVVDTGAVGKLDVGMREGLKYLIQGADYVYWVLPAENPWAAGTWDLVTEMRVETGQNSAVILQQKDRRQAEDIPLLLGHLRDLCLQRMGHALPIYAISAKFGLRAGVGERRDAKVWEASGFGVCWRALDDYLNGSPRRKRGLREAYDFAGGLLLKIEDHIDRRSRTLVSDQQYLQSIEAEIDRLREMEVQRMLRQVGWLGEVLASQCGAVLKVAKRKMGGLSNLISLFGRGDGAFAIERFLLERVTNEAEIRGGEQARRMLADCRGKWSEMRPAMEERLAVDVGDFREEVFEQQVEKFCEVLVKSMRREMMLMKLRGLLDRMMVARHKVMRKLLLWGLTAFAVGGFMGAFGLVFYPFGAMGMVGVGVVLFGVMWGYGLKTRSGILRSFAETLYDARPALIDEMREDYVDMIRGFFNGFTPMFESMRRKIADAQLELQPQMKTGGELFLALKAVEQDL